MKKLIFPFLSLLAGCTTLQPSAQVMPSAGKTLAVFDAEKQACTEYADTNMKAAADSYNANAIGTVVVTTVLGTGLGAAIGGGQGAAIGAPSGAIVGVAAQGGSGKLDRLQRQYDIVYAQCMYAKGNSVPVL
jgi:outer membrane lipoprotein SlyB